MRFVVALTLGAALGPLAQAGRYPVPIPISDLIGTARWIFVGKVNENGVIVVEERLFGKELPKTWKPRLRSAPPHSTGAAKPELKPGRRFVVFVEADGQARDATAIHAVDAKGKVTENGVIELGADLDAVRATIKERTNPKHRARLLVTLQTGSIMGKENAIRELARLRCPDAKPDLIAIAAKGPRRLREAAVAHLWMLEDPKVAPTLVRALRNAETSNIANYALQRLSGKQRDQSIALLGAASIQEDDFAVRARYLLERMRKKNAD